MTLHEHCAGAIDKLKARRATMKTYLAMKFDEEDWHGVQDAASDLRDIDAEIAAYDRVRSFPADR